MLIFHASLSKLSTKYKKQLENWFWIFSKYVKQVSICTLDEEENIQLFKNSKCNSSIVSSNQLKRKMLMLRNSDKWNLSTWNISQNVYEKKV